MLCRACTSHCLAVQPHCSMWNSSSHYQCGDTSWTLMYLQNTTLSCNLYIDYHSHGTSHRLVYLYGWSDEWEYLLPAGVELGLVCCFPCCFSCFLGGNNSASSWLNSLSLLLKRGPGSAANICSVASYTLGLKLHAGQCSYIQNPD